MSSNGYINPNFPIHGTAPTQSGAVSIPEMSAVAPQASRPAWGPSAQQQPQMGYGQQQPDFLSAAMAMMDAPIATSPMTGRPSGWSWETAEQKPLYDTSGIDEFLGNRAEQDQAVQYMAKQTASRIMIEVIRDVDNSISSGKYREMLHMMEVLKIDPTFNIAIPAMVEFINFVQQQPGLRKRIGRAAAIGLAGWTYEIIISQTELKANQMVSTLRDLFGNALIMEFTNWLSQTETGRRYLESVKHNPYLMKIISHLPKTEEQFAKWYMIFDKESPYQNLSIEPKITINHASDATRYASTASYGVPETSLGGNLSPSEGEALLARLIARNSGQYVPETKHISNLDFCGVPDTVQEMNVQLGVRTDYQNMNYNNRKEFNLESILKRINDTNWYVCDQYQWKNIEHAWTNLPHQRGMYFAGWPDTVLAIWMDLDNNSDECRVETLSIPEGLTLERILTNPALLLPELVQDERGEVVEVKQLDREELKREDNDGSEFYITVPDVVELRDKPVALNKSEPVVQLNPEIAETMLDTFFDKNKDPENKKVFAASMAIQHGRPVIMDSVADMKAFYKDFQPLIVGNGTRFNNFFKLLDIVYSTLQRRNYDQQMVNRIDYLLTTEFKRWLVECRGYGSTRKHPWYLAFDSLLVDHVKSENWFANRDKETYAALTNQCPELERLLERIQCIMPEEEAHEYFKDKSKDEFEAEINSRTIMFVRNTVMTRIGNLIAPSKDINQDMIRVKRSIAPELFAVIEASFGPTSKHMASAEVLLSFEDDDSTLWTFTTSDFDRRNVATLRRVHRTKDLFVLGIEG